MPDTSWTDRYAQTTADSHAWSSDQSFDDMIIGEVLIAGEWFPAQWIVLADRLHCPANRGFNVEMLIAPDPPPLVTYPTRALDADFVISADQDADVTYTIQLAVTATVLGLHVNSAIVTLTIDGAAVAEIEHTLSATILLGLTLSPTMTKTISARVPAGATVQLTSSISGTGVATLVSAQETLL